MGKINSRAKGARGERQWRDVLRSEGFTAMRGQQFSGGPDSPDVICEELAGLHFEVKCVQNLNLENAIEQATEDSGKKKHWAVVHKKNKKPWRVTISPELFFLLLREGMDGLKTNENTNKVPKRAQRRTSVD